MDTIHYKRLKMKPENMDLLKNTCNTMMDNYCSVDDLDIKQLGSGDGPHKFTKTVVSGVNKWAKLAVSMQASGDDNSSAITHSVYDELQEEELKIQHFSKKHEEEEMEEEDEEEEYPEIDEDIYRKNLMFLDMATVLSSLSTIPEESEFSVSPVNILASRSPCKSAPAAFHVSKDGDGTKRMTSLQAEDDEDLLAKEIKTKKASVWRKWLCVRWKNRINTPFQEDVKEETLLPPLVPFPTTVEPPLCEVETKTLQEKEKEPKRKSVWREWFCARWRTRIDAPSNVGLKEDLHPALLETIVEPVLSEDENCKVQEDEPQKKKESMWNKWFCGRWKSKTNQVPKGNVKEKPLPAPAKIETTLKALQAEEDTKRVEETEKTTKRESVWTKWFWVRRKNRITPLLQEDLKEDTCCSPAVVSPNAEPSSLKAVLYGKHERQELVSD